MTWKQLYDLAASQGGYFRARQAGEVGYSAQRLRPHVAAGRLVRTRRGIYRLADFPMSDDEDLVELWLWSHEQGVFSHETALSLHELSDAMPARIHMTVPRTWKQSRRVVPPILVLHHGDIPADDRTWVGQVPVTTPARTLRDAVDDHVDPTFIRQAIREGLARGTLRREHLRGIVPPPRGRPPGRRTRAQRGSAT